MKVMITYMTSCVAASRVWSVLFSQAATFYREGLQKLVPLMINALIKVNVKVKFPHYRPEQALGDPEG
jgi:hypothetical protein